MTIKTKPFKLGEIKPTDISKTKAYVGANTKVEDRAFVDLGNAIKDEVKTRKAKVESLEEVGKVLKVIQGDL